MPGVKSLCCPSEVATMIDQERDNQDDIKPSQHNLALDIANTRLAFKKTFFKNHPWVNSTY